MTDTKNDRKLSATSTAPSWKAKPLSSKKGRAASRQKGILRPWKPVFPTGRIVAVAQNTVITTATIMPKARVLTISTASCRKPLAASNDASAGAHKGTSSCVTTATRGKKFASNHKVFFTRKRIAL